VWLACASVRVHDAVVAAAGAGAAGTGAVAAQHLRGGPAVQLHQVCFGSPAVEPGMAEMVPEPVRMDGNAAFAAAAGNHLVDAVGCQWTAVVDPEP
jgi:hypothetical protein